MTTGTISGNMEERSQADTVHLRPRLIEMVGIGGAGKSTLFRALHQQNPKIQKLAPPRKVRYLPTILRLGFRWLPVYLSKYRATRWFTWDEMRNICYLDAQLAHVREHNDSQGVIAVLDPGSIYWLSALREFGPEFTTDPLFCKWWDERLAVWAAALDVIVWIEAPTELLLERVLARDEDHEARGQSREVALAHFERYQSEYSKMVPGVVGRGPARLFHFRSDQVSAEKMLEEIRAMVDLSGR
jgi:shikimate kinase